MKEFFKTKAGQLTLAFIVIMIAFAIVMAGLNTGSRTLSSAGFILILAAMLYSPFKMYILKKK